MNPGGQIAIIVPNGYLGNKSENYVNLRKWILKHTKVLTVDSRKTHFSQV